MDASSSRLQVAVRIRPFLSKIDIENKNIAATCRNSAVAQLVSVKGPEREKVFEFDHVLDGEQQELYQNVGEPMLKEAINGFNVCLFAFGNTGSGKTHSMHGPELANLGSVTSSTSNENNNAGLVPRLVDDLFSQLQQRIDEDPHLSVKVTLSVIEVYMEKVRDLLSTQNQSQNQQSSSSSSTAAAELKDLELQDDGARKVKVKGLSVHNVLNAERVKELLRSALSNRQVAETKSNEVSSRSHCLVQLTVTQFSESVNGHDIESVITVVDLAGSERQGRAETSGQQLEEGKKINLSLLTLGRALNALGEGRRDLVSLRDSKLTRLLGESLGGNSKTWMLATVAASSTHVTETLSTLEYATYARAIKNSGVHVNTSVSRQEIEALREQLNRLETSSHTLKQRTKKISKETQQLQNELGDALVSLNMAAVVFNSRLKSLQVNHIVADATCRVISSSSSITKFNSNNNKNEKMKIQFSGSVTKKRISDVSVGTVDFFSIPLQCSFCSPFLFNTPVDSLVRSTLLTHEQQQQQEKEDEYGNNNNNNNDNENRKSGDDGGDNNSNSDMIFSSHELSKTSRGEVEITIQRISATKFIIFVNQIDCYIPCDGFRRRIELVKKMKTMNNKMKEEEQEEVFEIQSVNAKAHFAGDSETFVPMKCSFASTISSNNNNNDNDNNDNDNDTNEENKFSLEKALSRTFTDKIQISSSSTNNNNNVTGNIATSRGTTTISTARQKLQHQVQQANPFSTSSSSTIQQQTTSTSTEMIHIPVEVDKKFSRIVELPFHSWNAMQNPKGNDFFSMDVEFLF